MRKSGFGVMGEGLERKACACLFCRCFIGVVRGGDINMRSVIVGFYNAESLNLQ